MLALEILLLKHGPGYKDGCQTLLLPRRDSHFVKVTEFIVKTLGSGINQCGSNPGLIIEAPSSWCWMDEIRLSLRALSTLGALRKLLRMLLKYTAF